MTTDPAENGRLCADMALWDNAQARIAAANAVLHGEDAARLPRETLDFWRAYVVRMQALADGLAKAFRLPSGERQERDGGFGG